MKRCPAINCEAPGIPNSRLMCRPHWKLVPEDLKRKMRAAFANIGATDPIAWDKITNKIKPSEANDRLKIYYTLEKEAVSSIMSKKVTSLK